ncbi:MAG: acetyl-CoA decarbonylase/synthase complex subunit gamma [bacterium]
MKLTGLQIFKYLPGGKKEPNANCKKCSFPTCMAFAMKLAKNETSIDKCEFITDELRSTFEEANQIQQAEIEFGSSENLLKIGNETVMFRHDKKFVNSTCIAVKLESSDENFDEKLNKISNYCVERVGEDLKISAVALIDSDETYENKAKKLAESKFPMILVSENIEKIKKILDEIKDSKPLISIKNALPQEIAEIEKKYNVPVVVSGSSIQELADISSKLVEVNAQNIVLSLNNQSQKSLIENLTHIRRSAIDDKFKPLGFPVMMFTEDITDLSDDLIEQGIWASALLCKYANLIVLENFDEAIAYSLLTLRQNIYTDPEKPLQIDAKLYPIGETDENSPVIATTNFALTYFTVVGEIEASNIPSYLVITPSDGMSVLTAWSADKFNGEIIAKAIKNYEIENIVKHRKLIIPGYVYSLKEEIEDELPDWEVVIGANEAVDIVDFLRSYQKQQASSKTTEQQVKQQ